MLSSFFYLSSYFRPLPSDLAELAGHMLGSRPKCDLKTHDRNVEYLRIET